MPWAPGRPLLWRGSIEGPYNPLYTSFLLVSVALSSPACFSLPLYRAKHVAARAGGQRNNRVSETQPEPANGWLLARSLHPFDCLSVRLVFYCDRRPFYELFHDCVWSLDLDSLEVLAPRNMIKTGRSFRSIRNREDRA